MRRYISPIWTRLRGYCDRKVGGVVFKRPFVIKSSTPVISFSFDDFPQSAVRRGGTILKEFNVVGTYYASLGLIGQEGPSGRLFDVEDLKRVFEDGHELGCHTFSHCHSGKTPPGLFEQALIRNRAALHELAPEKEFQTLAYPISGPRPFTKLRAGRHFLCCRGSGQWFNHGLVDLNNVAAYFLEKSRDRIDVVKKVIDLNRQAVGWLIFATHDIAETPTPYGCRPEFFEEVVRYSVSSGARILPVADALRALKSAEPDRDS